jgi:hypothetical protein
MVMTTSMLVAMIGMTGLTVTRLQFKGNTASRNMAKARIMAQSAVELGLYTIKNDDDWHTTRENDTWVTDRVFSGGEISWKIVDEESGDRSINPERILRLHGRGISGNATRIFSVELVPVIYENVMSNDDMSDGISPWQVSGDTGISMVDDSGRTDATSLKVEITNANEGTFTDITHLIKHGEDYDMAVWVNALQAAIYELKLTITTDVESVEQTIDAQFATDSTWTKLGAIRKLAWRGDLQGAYLSVSCTSANNAFMIDDGHFAIHDNAPKPIFVDPRSWRREPNE